MTDIQFYKSFKFTMYRFNRYRVNDCAGGNRHHFFARLIKGKARITADDITLHLKAGDVFYIPRELKYKSYWYPDEGGELVFSSFGVKSLPTAVSYKLQLIEITDTKLLDRLEQNVAVTPDSVALLYSFFAQISDKMEAEPLFSGVAVVQNAMECLNNEPHTSVPELAALCGVSESGLYKLFSKHLGKTPVDVRHKVLADKATDLLVTTDLPVEEVSRRLGFSSSSYFRKVFFKQTGKTPLAIRKNARSV